MPTIPAAPLDCNQPFVFDVPGQRFTWCGVGLCDVQLATTINGTIPFVYQRGAFQGTVAADSDPISFASQTVSYFTAGQGSAVPGNSNVTSALSDTNLSQNLDGSAAPNGMVFMAVGMAWVYGKPYVPNAAGTNPILLSPSWMNAAPNGANYESTAIQLLMDNTSLQLIYSDNGYTQNMGSPRHFPFYGAATGPTTTRTGQLGVIAFVPFVAKVCMGGPDSNRSLQINAVLNHAVNVGNNGSAPTVSPTGDTIFFPLEVILFGSICCVMDILKALSCVAQPGDVRPGAWAIPQLP